MQLLYVVEGVFEVTSPIPAKSDEFGNAEFYVQIGKLNMPLEALRKMAENGG